MKPHVARMMEEHEELRLRRDRLAAFFGKPEWQELKAWDKELLARQLTAMDDYLGFLGKRIERARTGRSA